MKLSGEDSPLADPWEEIKEQVQGEPGPCWPAYFETIEGTIDSTVAKLSDPELRSLSADLKVPAQDRPKLRRAFLARLLARAKHEKISYRPFDFDYCWYLFAGMAIYTQIVTRTGMHTCGVLAYSVAALSGERGEIDLAAIDRSTDIHVMTAGEFEKAKSLNWPEQGM